MYGPSPSQPSHSNAHARIAHKGTRLTRLSGACLAVTREHPVTPRMQEQSARDGQVPHRIAVQREREDQTDGNAAHRRLKPRPRGDRQTATRSECRPHCEHRWDDSAVARETSRQSGGGGAARGRG